MLKSELNNVFTTFPLVNNKKSTDLHQATHFPTYSDRPVEYRQPTRLNNIVCCFTVICLLGPLTIFFIKICSKVFEYLFSQTQRLSHNLDGGQVTHYCNLITKK